MCVHASHVLLLCPPAHLSLQSTIVSCEGYDYPEDPFILRGSCGLEYEIAGAGMVLPPPPPSQHLPALLLTPPPSHRVGPPPLLLTPHQSMASCMCVRCLWSSPERVYTRVFGLCVSPSPSPSFPLLSFPFLSLSPSVS